LWYTIIIPREEVTVMPTKEQKRGYDQGIRYLPWRQKQLREARAKYNLKHPWREYYEKHKEQIAKYTEKYREGIKVEVYSHYGREGKPICVFCGEDRIVCLSLDHINDGGTQERRRTGRVGFSLYSFLRSNKYPSGYQTLCMNCQFIKERARRRRKLLL